LIPVEEVGELQWNNESGSLPSMNATPPSNFEDNGD
jgi:hypothetical protein